MLFKLKSNKPLVFLDQAIVSGSNFILGILLARNLGIEGYGYYSLIWLVVLFFSSMQLASLISPMMSLGPKKKYNCSKKLLFYNDSNAVFLCRFIHAISIFIFLHDWNL